MEKAFLFDVASKLYICTDSGPVDMQAVELCSDMIDVVLDVSGIYGMKPVGGTSSGVIKEEDPNIVATADQQQQLLEDDSGKDNLAVATSGSADDIAGGVDAKEDEDADTLDNTNNTGAAGSDADADETVTIEGETSAYDSESTSIIQLSNGMVLYLKEVDTMLALVCLTRSENFRKKSLINYNIGCLKKALGAILPLPLQVVADDS